MSKESIYYIPMEVDEGAIKAFRIAKEDIKIFRLGSRLVQVYLVEATEEEYKDYMRLVWNEKKHKERERKCLIESENGTIIRCAKSCANCGRLKNGSILSLDEFVERNEYEIEDKSISDSSTLLDFILLEELLNKLDHNHPEYSKLFSMLYDEKSQREIAKEIGVSQSTLEYRIKKMRKYLQKFVNKEDLYR